MDKDMDSGSRKHGIIISISGFSPPIGISSRSATSSPGTE